MFTSCSTNSFDMSWVSQVLNYSNIPSSHHIREQTECAKYAMVLRHCNTMQKYKICRKMNQPYVYEIHIFTLRWRNEIERSSQLKKIQAHMGFEPMTSAIPVQRSTNWANKPTESRLMCWVDINHPSDEWWFLDIWNSYIYTAVKKRN